MFNFDNNMIPFAITLTLMTVLFIFGMIAFLIIVKSKQNRKSKEYMQSLIEEKERTMYSISLEVHDNLTQMLSVTRMNLHLLQDKAIPENVATIKNIGDMLDTLIIDTHNISHTLNPEYLKNRGLLASLEEEAKWVSISKKLDCVIKIEGKPERLDQQVELMAFRIAQEAIHNTIKYAHAKQILIKLIYTENSFEMQIRDNGVGFDNKTGGFLEGVGMLSMRQRAKIVNGRLDIISIPGNGTIISLNIPNISTNK